MEDLLSDELDFSENGVEAEVSPSAAEKLNGGGSTAAQQPKDGGIEDDIEKELADLAGEGVVGQKRKRSGGDGADSSANNKRKIGLVTLDIPCVSFVRFPSHTTCDPSDVAAKMCRDARAHPEQQRSRFIKRLTPLSKVRKMMSGGIEELCKDVLPAVFGGGEGFRYAVRVTVRNNHQIEKEQVIKTVAGAVRELGLVDGEGGESRHSVSLKGYDKLVLVEIYRNVVGMSVVGAEWESLRRFNLSEIYAEGRVTADKSAKVEQAVSKESSEGGAQGPVAPQEAPAEPPET